MRNNDYDPSPSLGDRRYYERFYNLKSLYLFYLLIAFVTHLNFHTVQYYREFLQLHKALFRDFSHFLAPDNDYKGRYEE